LKQKLNILFTSAGRRVSLLRSFKEALKTLGVEGHLVGADIRRDAPALYVADVRLQVPRVDDPNYMDTLLRICREFEIDLVIPLIDTGLPLLAENHTRFAEAGARLMLASPETVAISSDKRRTRAFFERAGVESPRVLDIDAHLADTNAHYPVMLKPAGGSAGIGVTVIRNAKELTFFRDYVPDPMLQEFVSGVEHTLDVLLDFEGHVHCVVPRRRIEVRAGEVSKGMTVKDPRIMAAGRQVAEALPGAVGCQTVQCFLSESGQISFIEINPRFGGGYPLSHAAGANYALWICQFALGQTPDIEFDGWRDGVVMLRYDAEIVVNRDDIQ
jgi:carbamoyl-phosphate synthase large subunit